VEVTNRCNLACPYCFAQSGNASDDPAVDQLSRYFAELVKNGNSFVQLSGGEPTVRDDLPEIIAAARQAGCENIQLNTNGIRLGQDKPYTKALAEAGLSFVFMQFDGTSDSIYETLRGRPLLAEKQAAIRACSDGLIGVILVPTLVPGVNDQNIGDILNFGISSSPAVRGVHFQPISYFGRYPGQPRDEDRITLPEVLRAIEQQTGGKIRIADFVPSGCDHPKCGFHGDFVVTPDSLLRLTRSPAPCCGNDGNAHIKNRRFVARRWKRTTLECCSNNDLATLDGFLERIRLNGFTITAMSFQDAYTIDLERLRRCSVHIYENGRTIPFCARYMTRFSSER
jgi:7,8-dihydro-6-hydroxymethylpterin dimethyltransferase